jgi:hypothetical protein
MLVVLVHGFLCWIPCSAIIEPPPDLTYISEPTHLIHTVYKSIGPKDSESLYVKLDKSFRWMICKMGHTLIKSYIKVTELLSLLLVNLLLSCNIPYEFLLYAMEQGLGAQFLYCYLISK